MPDTNLKGKEFKVPTKCMEKIKLALNDFTGPKTTKGYERAINMVKRPIISLELLKKINNFFRNEEKGTWPYKLTGGDYGKKIFHNEKTGSNPTNVNVPDPNVDLREQIDKINQIINYL